MTIKKTAQIPTSYDSIPAYGQGMLAGYGQGGYSPEMDNLQMLPGILPEEPKSTPVGSMAGWAWPIGLAASGLVGYSLLRRLGKGALQGASKLTATAAPKAVQGYENILQPKSFIYPGATVGEHAGTLANAYTQDPNILINNLRQYKENPLKTIQDIRSQLKKPPV